MKKRKKKKQPKTQKQKVLKHLLSGQSITPFEALGRFGCFRLSHIIWKLREAGNVIETKYIKKTIGRGAYAEYTLKIAK